MAIPDAHDIAETLQMKIESLEEVERCFVHIGVCASGRQGGGTQIRSNPSLTILPRFPLTWLFNAAQTSRFTTRDHWNTCDTCRPGAKCLPAARQHPCQSCAILVSYQSPMYLYSDITFSKSRWSRRQ
jgi:hypothetical protein